MVGLCVVGIAGYGKKHIETILELERDGLCSLNAVLVKFYNQDKENLENLKEIKPNLVVIESLEDLRNLKINVDIVTISTGIPSHKKYAIEALKLGYDVICEKPAAGNHADILAMVSSKNNYEKRLIIAYDFMFTDAIQKIRMITSTNELGKLKNIRGITPFKRQISYFKRNAWASKLLFDNLFLFDSPIQNSGSHIFQNALYISGLHELSNCTGMTVYCENYRVNEIESSDLQFIRVASDGIEIVIGGSLVNDQQKEAEMLFCYENGKIAWFAESNIVNIYNNIGELEKQLTYEKIDLTKNLYQKALNALINKERSCCEIEDSITHARIVELAYESMNPIQDVPDEYIDKELDSNQNIISKSINNSSNYMCKILETGLSFFEMGIPWAKKGKMMNYVEN